MLPSGAAGSCPSRSEESLAGGSWRGGAKEVDALYVSVRAGYGPGSESFGSVDGACFDEDVADVF